MKKVTRNEVDFSEIFDYADEKFGIDWDRANDMFFGNSLDYKSHNEFHGGTTAYYNSKKSFEELDEDDKGYYIINQFMLDNNLDNLWIDNK